MTTDPSTDEAPVTATPPEPAFRTTWLDNVTPVGSNAAEQPEAALAQLGLDEAVDFGDAAAGAGVE